MWYDDHLASRWHVNNVNTTTAYTTGIVVSTSAVIVTYEASSAVWTDTWAITPAHMKYNMMTCECLCHI